MNVTGEQKGAGIVRLFDFDLIKSILLWELINAIRYTCLGGLCGTLV